MIHTVTLVKPAKRQLRASVIESNLTDLVQSVNTKSLKVQGYRADPDWRDSHAGSVAWDQAETVGTYKYTFHMFLVVHTPDPEDKQIVSGMIRKIAGLANTPKFGSWELELVDDEEYTVPDDANITGDASEDLAYASVTMPGEDVWEDRFSHLYGLDSHVTRIRKALQAAIDSGWTNRFHCALIGPPGCGKSDIGETVADMLGPDVVMKFDATSTTAAGAIKKLSEMQILPRVIILEEIEKAPEASMQFLLGILDLRGEIRKTTARGDIQRNTKLFAIATVNDLALFEKLQANALASRFMNRIHFKRTGRDVLYRILAREVRKIDGDEKWIEPTLDYCEIKGIVDPRLVIAVCLTGADDLLTGEYQRMMDETSLDTANDD